MERISFLALALLLACSPKAGPSVMPWEGKLAGGEAETVLSVGKGAAMGQVTLRLGKQRRALLRAYGILED